MNTTTDIDLRIKAFKASSIFTPGDPYSFSIAFSDEITLPGKYDPDEYMRLLCADVTGKNVLVVCPGNSGLCVAALRAGASTVVAFEPRVLYHKAMATISEFTSEIVDATFVTRTSNDKLVETFDVVIWPEGVDDIQHPKDTFDTVFAAAAPGGLIYLEIAHGTHGILPESTNCWKPTKEALEETIEGLGDFEVIGHLAGRNQVRTIYTIQNKSVRVDKLPGPDHQSVDEVKAFADKVIAFADKVEAVDKRGTAEAVKDLQAAEDAALADYAAASTTEHKVEALEAAVEALGKKTERLVDDGYTPSSAAVKRVADKIKEILPTETPVGELDSIYEGMASTPKSKAKKGKSTPKRGRRPKKNKPKS